MKCSSLFLLVGIPEFAAAKVYTGFNYGAFWTEQANVKRYADFHHGFELAKNLTNTPVSFDSARLYTCITAGTKHDPTEAFQAAIDTGTNLLLGMWVSPGTTGQPNDVLVDNELTALGKAFDKHGQSLSDLIIGLSVGNEDVYRFTNEQAGVDPDNLRLTIQTVREKIEAASWGKFMQGKPIGHTDTSAYAVMSDSDFIGMTAYPYWKGKSIDEANASFIAALKDTQKRAGNTPVWISEVGWPINGSSINQAVASADNYQRYWNEVGCQVFGKYNTFWFELLRDSAPEQPDWGLLDTKTYQPRIRDLSCPGRSNVTASATGNPQDFSGKLVPTTLPKVYAANSTSSSGAPSSSAILPISQTRTVHITQTHTTVHLTTTSYVSAPPTPNTTLPSTNNTASDDKLTVCIAMMDLTGDGTFTPVATYARDISTCAPPPVFTGSPFTIIASPTSVPQSIDQKSLFDLYANSTAPAQKACTAVQPNGPVCVTSAGRTYGGVVLHGHTYTGGLTMPCPSDEGSAPALIVSASIPVTPAAITSRMSSSASWIFSSFLSASSGTTFSTITIPAPTNPVSLAPSSSPTFSHSLAWSMFASHSPSPSPTPLPTPTPQLPCPSGALVCLPASGTSFWAEISSNHANTITRNGNPVPCSFTNTCTWNPAPTPPPTCAKEGDTICLAISIAAVIKNNIPVVLNPRRPCAPPAVQLTACPPPASAPGGSPSAAPMYAVLSILSEAREGLEHTTWASPLPPSSMHSPAVVRTPIPAAAASSASSSMRGSPGPTVLHEAVERRKEYW